MLFRFSEVTKSFGGAELLRGVTFQVNPGEKVGLVGRNGAGKTTVFRLLTGRESPDSGEIVKSSGLSLGLLEQHVDFSPHESVHTSALSAFARVHDLEVRMRILEQKMATDASEAILEEYSDLQHEFELADGFTYAARAEAVLQGLGFDRDMWPMETRKLSGGQKNRLGMVRVLLSRPDVFLLDEPTNHLDVSGVEWLENFLQAYDGSFVVISHDRYFLDRTVNKIVEIDRGKALTYHGNYSKFAAERTLRREQRKREYENQQAAIAKTEEFIRRNLEGQKTKQAKSRRNMLERLDRIEAVEEDKSGGNFKLRKIERAGNNVLTVEDLVIGYGENVLASGLNFTIHRGEALGVIGGNGTGKTTLLKTLLRQQRELDGTVTWGTKTYIGYYSQNLEDLDPRNEIIQEIRRIAPLVDNGELRSYLARFLFFGDDVFKRVGELSGGEKGRLALAKLIYSQKNVLVLDEPTNHLDIRSREALESALEEYEGTIITVSHDRFFLDKIATEILSFESDRRTQFFYGNYTEFHDWKERRTERPPETGTQNGEQRAAENKIENATGRLSKNQRMRLEERIKEIEIDIPEREEQLRQIGLEMTLPHIAADHKLLKEVGDRYRWTELNVQQLYSEWDEINRELERDAQDSSL